jgi:phospholipase C
MFAAFTSSKHWKRGLFLVTYDEWGGFFDHVEPPVLPDDHASSLDGENFGQAGFRVPTVIASPYARRGFVDHRQYDHTSILRFLEWRFLGAPSEGPGRANATWFLTERDRHANNLGASLSAQRVAPDVGFDLDIAIAQQSAPCAPGHEPEEPSPTSAAFAAPGGQRHSLEQAMHAGYFERIGIDVRVSPLARQWAKGATIVHH